jgi:hypothetical protein
MTLNKERLFYKVWEAEAVGSTICLVGTDGSGKTTQAKLLLTELNRKGCPTKYLWFRFPYFLTLMALFVAKVTGFTKKVSNGEKQITVHSFHLQPFRMLHRVGLLNDNMSIEKRGLLCNIPPSYLANQNAPYPFLKQMCSISIAQKLPLHICSHRGFGSTKQLVQRNLKGVFVSFAWMC